MEMKFVREDVEFDIHAFKLFDRGHVSINYSIPNNCYSPGDIISLTIDADNSLSEASISFFKVQVMRMTAILGRHNFINSYSKPIAL